MNPFVEPPRARGSEAVARHVAGSPGRGSHSHVSGRRPGSVVGVAHTLAPRRVAQRLSARRGASAHAPTASSGTEAVCLMRWEPAPTTSSGTEAACPTWCARGWLAPHDVAVELGALRGHENGRGRLVRRRLRPSLSPPSPSPAALVAPGCRRARPAQAARRCRRRSTADRRHRCHGHGHSLRARVAEQDAPPRAGRRQDGRRPRVAPPRVRWRE